MIRTVMSCEAGGCLALYVPDADAGADVLERAARRLGWRRRTTYTHTCPACAAGRGPVLERGTCPVCAGLTADLPDGATCHYCQTITPHPDN
ncbi:hypothetical protein [Streptomyces liangshanensis]|uniref:hypothetical protein n=1 Tax=Streptomyces liangshanensis TaxID=2717324 RepID=UPI0036D9B1CA